MTVTPLEAHPSHRPTHPAPAVDHDHGARRGRRSTALPAFTELGENDTLGRHYARLYQAYRGADPTTPIRGRA